MDRPDTRVPPNPRRPPAQASLAALQDALVYPMLGGALAAWLAITALRVLASGLPHFAPLFHLLLWLALYKFALEVLAASAIGNARPPDVLGQVEDSVHRRHVLVQLLVLLGLSAVLVFAPEWKTWAAFAAALVLPGLIFSLAISQNLTAALLPQNWAVVAAKLGLGYPLLVLAWWSLLLVQLHAVDWVGLFPQLLAVIVYFAVTQYLVLALFRWMGLFLHAHGEALGWRVDVQTRPVLAREREQLIIGAEVRAAREQTDPGKRAEQLREAVQRGAAEPIQREYRQALRASGNLAALGEHAAVRCSELAVTGRLAEAVQLAHEALQDDAAFTLPDSGPLLGLLQQLEHSGQWRLAAALAVNYRTRYRRRRDSLELAEHAAVALADHLHQIERARELLQQAIEDASGERREALARLLTRLDAGIALRGAG